MPRKLVTLRNCSKSKSVTFWTHYVRYMGHILYDSASVAAKTRYFEDFFYRIIGFVRYLGVRFVDSQLYLLLSMLYYNNG
jgi:hypothetical protein